MVVGFGGRGDVGVSEISVDDGVIVDSCSGVCSK